MTIPDITKTTPFEEELAESFAKIIISGQQTAHSFYKSLSNTLNKIDLQLIAESMPSTIEVMDAMTAAVTGLPINILDDDGYIDDQQLPQEVFQKQTTEIGKASDFTNTPDTI